MLSEGLACLPKEGAGNPVLRREVQGGVPLFLKTSEGGAGGIAASATISLLLPLGTRGQVRKPRQPPIAKYELLCYGTPMKWAAGPLLLLGACRIHIALEANHRESPCGRSAEGTTQGARPSEEGWNRSQCRYKAQALWSHPAPLRFRYGSLRSHYGSFTVPLRFLYGSLRPITPLLRLRAYTHQNPAD